MRLRAVLVASLAAIMMIAVLPTAAASAPDVSGTNYASARLRGADEGFDIAELRLTESWSPGTTDLYLYLELCDVKTDVWPWPPGLEPECWYTGFGSVQNLEVDSFVFSPGKVALTGSVEMFCILCNGEPSRMVDVQLEWDVNDVTHTYRQFSPFPGLNVRRNTWDLEMGGFTLVLDGLPFELETMAATDYEGQIETTLVQDNT